MTTDQDTATKPDAGRMIGALLRSKRETTGMSVPEVSRALRIRQIYLEAIEADDYSSLPGKTYVLGFLRSYSDLLGLDSDDVVQRYRRQTEYTSLPQSPLNFPMHALESRMPRGAVIILSLLLAGGAVYGGARYFGADDAHRVDRVAPVPDRLIAGDPVKAPTPTFMPRQDPASAYAAQTPPTIESNDPSRSVPAVAPAPQAPVTPPASEVPQIDSTIVAVPSVAPPAAPQAAVAPTPAIQPPPVAAAPAPVAPAPTAPGKPAANAAAKPADKPSAATSATPPTAPPQVASLPADAPASKPRDVVVVARVDSWIEVRDLNNRPLVSLLLRVGDSYRVPSGANYRLVTGDLRGLEVRVDGVSVPQKTVDDGRLHRTMSLDTDRLSGGTAVVE